jgi:transcription-repair coupling factor (superfamily II helicase)
MLFTRQHGVGRFVGIRTVAQGEQTGDFMVLEYSNEAKLYVPLTRMDLVSKFRGAGEGTPPLDRLGGATWNKTKSRVKARMRDMAGRVVEALCRAKALGRICLLS